LRLAGEPAWRRAAAASGTWQTLAAKDALMLARLAVNGPQLRTTLAAWLWPKVAPPRANANLRQRLFRLRQLEAALVLEDGARLQLAPGVMGDGPLPSAAADSSAAEPPVVLDAPQPFLAGIDAQLDDGLQIDWLDQARHEWATHHLDQLTRRALQQQAAGALAAALGSAVRLVMLEPLREHSWRLVMRVHHQRGDRAAAISAFERCEAVLRNELGVRPGPETLALLADCEALTAAPESPASALHRGPLPPALLRPPQRVGRDAPLARMAAAWQAGRPFMLVGEAGLGKSRLLSDFAEQLRPADEANAVVTVAARPGDDNQPFGFVARWLRQALQQAAALQGRAGLAVADMLDPALHQELARWLPELANAPAAPAQPALLQAALEGVQLALAEAGLRGVLIDDWQHADVASQEALWRLVLGGGRLRWGLASRPSAAMPNATTASSARLERLVIERLTDGDTATLLTSLGPLPGLPHAHPAAEHAYVRRVVRHCGGNPLFLLETLKLLVLQPGLAQVERWPVPATVQAVLDSRLETLSPQALALARLIALAEADLSAETAALCLEADAAAVAQARAELHLAQFVGMKPGTAAFEMTHEVVRDAVIAAWPPALRTVWHGRLARTLSTQGAAPASIARQAELAGDHALTAAAALQAAEAARQLGRAPERLAHLQQASAAYLRAGQPDAAFRAQLAAIEPQLAMHGAQLALQACAQLADEMATQPAALCKVELVRAGVALNGYRPEEAERAARAALLGLVPAQTGAQAQDETLQDRLGALRAHLILGAALAMRGKPDEALATIAPWQSALQAVNEPQLAASLWSQWALVQHAAGMLPACEVALQRQRQFSRQAGDVATEAQALSSLAGIQLLLGDAEACVALAQRAGDLHRRMGEPHSALLADFNRAIALIGSDRFGAADHVLRDMQALAPSAGDSQLVAILNELNTEWCLRLHQPQQALARMALDAPPEAALPRRLNPLLFRALAWQQQGNAARAVESWQALDEMAQAAGPAQGVGAQFRALVMCSVVLPAAQAWHRLDTLLPLAQAASAASAQALVRMRRAALALRNGDLARAQEDAHWLLAMRTRSRHLFVSTAELFALVHRVFEAAGNSAAAGRVAHDAQRWFVDELQPQLPAGTEAAWRCHPAHASLFAQLPADAL
jgi:DNA-binding SARP family transcriptional activator